MYSHPANTAAMKTALSARFAKGTIAVAACVSEINAAVPSEIQLTPAGFFRARDGRPAGIQGWYVDATVAARVMQRMAALKGDVVIDYEHQTLNAETNGQPAPAAGWFAGGNVEWREGQGLFATNVQWTPNAAAAIAALEYRYLSPVLEYDPKTGEVLRVLMIAVTNFPAIDGLGELTARAAARFLPQDTQHEELPVKREELIALLGLAATATDADIQTEMAALKAKADQVEALNSEVAALKTKQVDPAKFVPITVVDELKTQIAALSGKITGSEVASVIAQAQADGKLLPVQVEWAQELGNKDIAALKSYIEKTPAIAALTGSQTNGKAPAGVTENGELDSTALAVCKQLGLSADEYKKSVGAAA